MGQSILQGNGGGLIERYIKPIESGSSGSQYINNLKVGKLYILSLLYANSSYIYNLNDAINSGAEVVYSTRITSVNDSGVLRHVLFGIIKPTSETIKFHNKDGSCYWAYTTLDD